MERKDMENLNREGKCIVIGAGDLTVNRLEYDPEKDYLIAVDGGIMYCQILEVEPDLLLGDFDSVNEEWKEAINTIALRVPEKVEQLCPEKDDTDMYAALKRGLEAGYRDFRIYGGTGGRLEHTIANIQCLLFLKHQGAKGYIMDGSGMMLVVENESVSFRREMEGYLSVFSLGKEARGVTLTGLKYPLDGYTMKNDYPIGISNEFIGEEATVTVEDGQLVLLVSWAM